MTTLEDFDRRRDGAMISALERAELTAADVSAIEKQAIANALMTHPVSRFVLHARVQSTLYPAISGSYHGLHKLIFGTKARQDRHIRNCDRTDRPNMSWSLPGRDPKSGCGVFRSNGNLPVKMCTNDPKHYMRAVSNHCGSLRCRNCMNYSAMMAGVNIEERICTPPDIKGRKTGIYDLPKHWAISPPQEWFKSVLQRSDHFAAFVDDLVRLLPAFGFYSGVLVCHPWRLSEDGEEWIFSPHLHAVGFGMFDNMGLRDALAEADRKAGGIWNDDGKEDSWVFNQIHPDEPLRSVRHTVGYIMTHAGLASYDHDVDWIDAADRISIPIAPRKGNEQETARTIAPTTIIGDGWRECGFWPEHLEEFDWLQWTEDQCASDFQAYRCFGKVNSLRTLCDFSERVPRICPDCGQQIGRFRNVRSCAFEPVLYDRSSKIRVMKEDAEDVRSELAPFMDDLKSAGLDILDAAMSVPQCSTPETKGLQDLQRLRSPNEKAEQYDRRIAYVPSKYGMGWDPVVLTRAQYAVWQRTGLLPSNVVVPDSIRIETVEDRLSKSSGSHVALSSGKDVRSLCSQKNADDERNPVFFRSDRRSVFKRFPFSSISEKPAPRSRLFSEVRCGPVPRRVSDCIRYRTDSDLSSISISFHTSIMISPITLAIRKSVCIVFDLSCFLS